MPKLSFNSASIDHSFPIKKTSIVAPPGYAQPSFLDGIIKNNWVTKHHSLLPSVVIFIIKFSMEWSAGEWGRREGSIQESYAKMKSQIASRDAKIVLVVVRVGPDTTDKELADERMSSLKRHLGIEGKYIFVFNPTDFAPQSVVAKRLGKLVRELSNAYYKFHTKRLKRFDKLTGKAVQPMLIARYNFKAAFYYQFQGQPPKALNHYQQCYVALVSMLDSADPDTLEQVKTIAEWTNMKMICILLNAGGRERDTAQQFRTHIGYFSRKVKPKNLWRHYTWLANQYHIHVQLLDKYSVASSALDANRSFFYVNIAKFSRLSQEHYLLACKSTDADVTYVAGTIEEELKSMFPRLIHY